MFNSTDWFSLEQNLPPYLVFSNNACSMDSQFFCQVLFACFIRIAKKRLSLWQKNVFIDEQKRTTRDQLFKVHRMQKNLFFKYLFCCSSLLVFWNIFLPTAVVNFGHFNRSFVVRRSCVSSQLKCASGQLGRRSSLVRCDSRRFKASCLPFYLRSLAWFFIQTGSA